MSKEQTPTVFEMFFKLESHFPSEVKELYLQKEQEQIKAKVLEALERVQNKATIYGVNVSWIETEIKPKYQNKDE
jgi:hypothetical protein